MEVLLKTFLAFISTNIDDLCIMSVLFAVHPKKDHTGIHAGHFIGMTVLVALSIAASFGAKAVLGEYIKYLGIIPIIVGIRYYFSSSGDDQSLDDAANTARFLFLAIAGITVANGADNIVVYTSVFLSFTRKDMFLSLTLFAVLTVLLGTIAAKIADITGIRSFMKRYSKYFVPVLLIAIGLMTLLGV